ncbi:MAG: hypothetical protein IPK83_24315 [Planctomycetes bacterium]|nr:hypothetical protein [Planctomycetota bacterium]
MTAKLTAICSVLLLTIVQQSPAQTPLSSEFTYQGSLKASGLPALTTADFQFTLFDAVTGGAQDTPMLSKNNVALVDGTFTLALDFGGAPFSGNARWLQVAVRSPAGAGAFTTLAPRQPITAAPNATYSSNTRGIVVDDSGNVGVGLSPNNVARLKVDGNVAVPPSAGFFALNAESTNVVAGMYSNLHDSNLEFFAGTFGSMHLDSNGTVGIKVSEPAGTLHVRTFGFLGFDHEPLLILEGSRTASVQLFPRGHDEPQTAGEIGFSDSDDPATLYIHNADPAGKIAFTGSEGTRIPSSGKEDLRIIRGRVDPDGSIVQGTGFSVIRVLEGHYEIDFDTPFASPPVATANSITVGFSSCFIEISGASPNSISLIVVRRSDGDVVDGRFCFIAMGPRS